MHENIKYLVETYTKIFLASSPIAVMALYVTMTPKYTPKERWVTSKSACHFAFALLLICGFFGDSLLEFIGIQMNSFRVAGGLILALIAFELLRSNEPDQLTDDEMKDFKHTKKSDIIITPLAFPLILGPGAISSTMIAKGEAVNTVQTLFAYVDIVLIMLTFYLMFYITSFGSKWLSPTVIRISSRLSGLVLLGLAFEFILAGLKGFFRL